MPHVGALLGVTLSCPRPAALCELLSDGLGWELACTGAIGPGEERAWGVAAGSAGAHFAVLRSPGATRGMLRVVEGPERRHSQRLAARWAGAEILVTREIDALYERLCAFPAFVPRTPPFDMDWSAFGSNVHRAFIGYGPGGTHLAFTMAVTQPRGRRFPEARARVGHVFDVPLVSARYAASRRFYTQALGLVPILEAQFSSGPWHALWALPDGSPVHLDILKGEGQGTGLGGIELQGYAPELIDSTPALADRFDGGACMISYETNDLDAVFKSVSRSSSATLHAAPVSLPGPPYAGARSFCFAGPDGERVEICEAWRV